MAFAKFQEVFFVLVLCFHQGTCQLCEPNFPDFAAPSKHSRMLRRQLIIPNFAFTCAATITRWETLLHMDGKRSQLARIDFQVWRLDGEGMKYHLAGSNSNIGTRRSNFTMEGDRLVMEIQDPMNRVDVEPGDIIGVFVRGEGIELRYRESNTVQIYIVRRDLPLEEEFDKSFESDGIFRSGPFEGIPMIRASIDFFEKDLSNTLAPFPMSSHLSTTSPPHPSTVSPPHLSTVSPPHSSTVSPPHSKNMSFSTNTTDSVTSESTNIIPANNRAFNSARQQVLIGGCIGGGIIIFLLTSSAIVLCFLIQKRKQGHITEQSNGTARAYVVVQSRTSDMSGLSHLGLNTQKKENLLAFKRQEAAPCPASNPSTITEAGMEAKRVGDSNSEKQQSPIKDKETLTSEEQKCIKTEENISYSKLSAESVGGGGEEEVVYHEYDVPELVIQASEYETPMESTLPQNVYETIDDKEEQIYEEIK